MFHNLLSVVIVLKGGFNLMELLYLFLLTVCMGPIIRGVIPQPTLGTPQLKEKSPRVFEVYECYLQRQDFQR